VSSIGCGAFYKCGAYLFMKFITPGGAVVTPLPSSPAFSHAYSECVVTTPVSDVSEIIPETEFEEPVVEAKPTTV